MRNSRSQVRNVFWALDRVAIHQPYNKSAQINEKGDGVTRFLPVQLCLPLLRFLVYVRPALPTIYRAAGLEYSPSNYLFRSYMPGTADGGPVATKTVTMSKGLRTSSEPFGRNFTLQTYRQAAIAIGYRFLLPHRAQEDLIRARLEETLEQQAGHHHSVTSMNYNQDGHLLPGMQCSKMELMFTVSDD